ncbi:hypothetical protein S245_005033, partial [Arachis hypogaea]
NTQDLLFVRESLYEISLSNKAEWRWMPIEKIQTVMYTSIEEDSSPDVMVLSGSEPSDDEFSSDGNKNNDQDGAL